MVSISEAYGRFREKIRRKTADDYLEELGYEWLSIGNKGASYEKFTGRTDVDHGGPIFKVIRFEKTDDGDYIFICCDKVGTAGKGHKGTWMTYEEMCACYKKLKELKKGK